MIKAINSFTYTIKRQMARSNRYRQTLRELNNLTNKELADIGISRWDIPRIAREYAEGNNV